MAGVSLRLLVLKTPQVDRLRAFYQALGVELAEEQHGSGPVHYAGQVGDTVLEVYPLPDGAAEPPPDCLRAPPGWLDYQVSAVPSRRQHLCPWSPN
jgi:hypothetical protein